MSRPARKKLPERRLKAATPPEIERGGHLERVIFKPRRKPVTLAALHRALDPVNDRGTTAIKARLVYEGRPELRPTFHVFKPEEIAKVFAGCGYRVEEAGRLPMALDDQLLDNYIKTF